MKQPGNNSIMMVKHDRRRFLTLAAGSAATASFAGSLVASETGLDYHIHRFEQSTPFPINAYVVEGKEGLVAVDSTLTNTSSKALKQLINELGKPLKAVLLTHPHPDHYAGIKNLVANTNAEIVSIEGVNTIVRRDDEIKNKVIGDMFGSEWPNERRFPERIVKEGETINYGPGLSFEVMDIGPAESFHDSVFIHTSQNPSAFIGDLAYGMMHPYMADNQNENWIRAIDRLQSDLQEDMVLYVCHGQPITSGFLQWQKSYLSVFESVLRGTDWTDIETATSTISTQMQDYLPNDTLLFFMQLSIEPNAKRLGLIN